MSTSSSIDGAISARGATRNWWRPSIAPARSAAANPEPVLALPSHQLVFADEVGQAHLRLRFKSGDGATVNAVAFRSVGQKLGNALIAHRGSRCMSRDRSSSTATRETRRVQLRVLDVAVPDHGPMVIR